MSKQFEQNLKRIQKISARVSDNELVDKEKAVREILKAVKEEGDQAVAKYSQRLDKHEVDLSKSNPFGIQLQGKKNFENLSEELQEALIEAKERITQFHLYDLNQGQLAKSKHNWSFEGPMRERLGANYNPIDAVAIYVPGGQAPLISTVLMTAIPAKVAGVKRVVMFSPPPISSEILAAAELTEVDEVYAIGGAQAVAAAAYGTESIQPVDKIVGPGNIYVSLAKKQVYGKIGIDGIYGPSELGIIADDSAKPKELAADLLSQLEHGSGLESVLLLTDSEAVAEQTLVELKQQIQDLRNNLMNIEDQEFFAKSQEQISTIINSLEKWSDILVCSDLDEAVKLMNIYAPEHLELQSQNAHDLVPQLTNAGAIFIGRNSCESLGDYIAGPSHCLPTGGTAKFSSGLQCSDFVKKTSILDFSTVDRNSAAYRKLAKQTAKIARAEQLEGHARAIDHRLS